MLAFLIELFFDVLLEGLLELVLEGGMEIGGGEKRHPALATLGYLVLGGILGGLSVWLLPERLLAPGPIGGLSLIVNPLVAGLAMDLWGRYRRSGGHQTTNLATWFGGGALALGMSLVRYLGVH